MKKKLFCLLLVAALIAALTVSVSAASSADVDMDAEGSISVTLETENKTVVTDGSMTLYQVATLGWDDGNMTYTYTDAFANCGIVLGDNYEDMAGQYAEFVQKNGLTGVKETLNENGDVTFSDLTLGLYLITTSSETYTANPFLVSVPWDNNGVWQYNVVASPKVEATPKDTDTGDNTSGDENPSGGEDITPSGGTTTTTDDGLPHTGQLDWPIPVLLIAGLILFGVGWYVAFGKRKMEAEA